MHIKLSYWNEKIISVYILLIPFISAFSFSPWLPLPLAFMMLISIYILFSRQFKIGLFKRDWEILVMIVFGIIGFVFSTLYFGYKNINHTFAIVSSVLFYYFLPKNLLLKQKSIKTYGFILQYHWQLYQLL